MGQIASLPLGTGSVPLPTTPLKPLEKRKSLSGLFFPPTASSLLSHISSAAWIHFFASIFSPSTHPSLPAFHRPPSRTSLLPKSPTSSSIATLARCSSGWCCGIGPNTVLLSWHQPPKGKSKSKRKENFIFPGTKRERDPPLFQSIFYRKCVIELLSLSLRDREIFKKI